MPSILVVDDERATCHAVAEILSSNAPAPLTIDRAYSLGEAKTLVANKKYDVVWCDYDLGDGDGVQLAQYIRAEGRGSPAFFLLTATTQEKIKKDHLEFEDLLKDKVIVEYVNKPPSRDGIRDLTRMALLQQPMRQ